MEIKISEKQFLEQVIDLAKLSGYEFIYHVLEQRNFARRTSAGFPDLIITRDGRLIVVELKTEKGQPTPEQYFWLLEFLKIPGTEVYLWKPSDWEEIIEVLRG